MIRNLFKIVISVLAATAAMALVCQGIPELDGLHDSVKFIFTVVLSVMFWLIVVE